MGLAHVKMPCSKIRQEFAIQRTSYECKHNGHNSTGVELRVSVSYPTSTSTSTRAEHQKSKSRDNECLEWIPCPWPCLQSNPCSLSSCLQNPEPFFTLITQNWSSSVDQPHVLFQQQQPKLNPIICLAVCPIKRALKLLFFWAAVLIAVLLLGFFILLAILALPFTSKFGFKCAFFFLFLSFFYKITILIRMIQRCIFGDCHVIVYWWSSVGEIFYHVSLMLINVYSTHHTTLKY